ncbi:DUF5624 domain-containing protein [Streptomyces olivoreticuli]|uniref:DUF5624 domain-containing protein n=1 Tax=Streptomyces olivoreticuli TaxID=68246 RepID=UPI00265AD673|nr:DUF5624 domain-containing protein [Streptomyces olivoreticuli]WKK24053.1 DUF5624 domain-containing protein [Streptomyces olivoreticuli]
MPSHESPELVDLFTTYTAGPGSIGSHLTGTATAHGADDPLIVATGADFALYPGGGRAPMVEGFRLSIRGFKELAAVSHLGPALATLVRLRTGYGDGDWRTQAERLLRQVERSRKANSTELWRDTIAVDAYRGRERAIAGMVDYSCAMTARYLRAALADEDYLTPETLRGDYLDGGGTAELPVPLNRMMIATFFLIGLDTFHRILGWFRTQRIDWDHAMVVVAGQQGRPTGGVTWNTSSVVAMILGASEYRLPLDRLYLAPHAPTFATPLDGDLGEVAALEEPLRRLWSGIRETVELGTVMFDGYPRFLPGEIAHPDVSDHTVTGISEMPVIHGPDDWRAMTTRLRVVLEDPRQLLSGCVTDYAVQQLVAADNDPAGVVVPGLDRVDYPTGL